MTSARMTGRSKNLLLAGRLYGGMALSTYFVVYVCVQGISIYVNVKDTKQARGTSKQAKATLTRRDVPPHTRLPGPLQAKSPTHKQPIPTNAHTHIHTDK